MEHHEKSDWQVVGRTGNGRAQQQAQPLLIDVEPESSQQVTQPRRHPLPSKLEPSRGISPKMWTKTRRSDTKRRHPPDFHAEFDNQAIEAWRRHEPPVLTVRIPDELILQEDKFLHAIARQHGTFVFTEHRKASAGSITFGIWGENAAASDTRQAIHDIVTEWKGPKKSHRSAAFAKVVSLTPNGRIRAEKEWKREVTRQRFRQYPPPDKPFGAIGTFYWPLQDYRPEEVLGMNYEALDAIRMDCASYVVFVPERSAFQIMGAADSVQEGLLRIRKTCFQIAARQIAPIRLYLLAWPEGSHSPSHVYLQPYDGLRLILGDTPNKAQYSSPRGHGLGMYEKCQLQQQSTNNEDRVRNILLKTLPNLHYYRGHINLRIRLGTFLATQFRKADGMYELADYEAMTRASQFTGQVTEEIGDWATECVALRKLQNAEEILVPHDALTHSLEAVKPIYNVHFTFADEHGDLRLAMSWVEVKDEASETTTFEAVSKKWTRLERDTGTASPIIDISLKDLNSGLAWHFDMRASQAIEECRAPDKLLEFVDSIRIDEKQARKATLDKSFVVFKPNTGPLKFIQQRISYRYGIKGSDYTVELTNYQNRTLSPRKSPILPPEQSSIRVYEPRWSLDVYRMDWDRLFTSNERLPVGERADWEHDAETWFPQDIAKEQQHEGSTSVGFAQLMEKLHMLVKLLQ